MPKVMKALQVRLFSEGYTHADIGKVLGRSNFYVQQRLSKARYKENADNTFSERDMARMKKALGIQTREEFLSLFFPDEVWEEDNGVQFSDARRWAR